MNQSIITSSDEQTLAAGIEFSKKLKPMDTVLLQGDLGSGKTTFTKGIAKGLGIERRVISPTFVLVRTYNIDTNSLVYKNTGILKLYHLDLYRLTNVKEVVSTDLMDYLADENAVTVIEWPEIGFDLFKKKVWKISIENMGEDKRSIEINYG